MSQPTSPPDDPYPPDSAPAPEGTPRHEAPPYSEPAFTLPEPGRPESAPPTPPPVPTQPAPTYDQPAGAPYAPGSATVPSYPSSGSGYYGYQPAEPALPTAPGAQGAQGAPGAQGALGVQGAPGAQGAPGVEYQMAQPPTSGAPSSGVPGYVPASGPPYPEAGYMYGAPPPPPGAVARRGRGTTILLSVLLALFVLVAGVMTTLYVTKSSELNKTRKDLTAQVSDRDAKLTTQGKDLDQAKKDLQAKIDELNDVKQQLTGSQNTAEELKRQKQVIAKCIKLLGEAGMLADQGKTSQAQAKLREAQPVCTEADRYLT